jgi:hypothetical protein
MSGPIEEMITNGKKPPNYKGPAKKWLPDDWEVYHANTQCALEAGHVNEDWFHEFYGMIADEMRDVRMKGLFAVFEGVIFKTFNPFIHVLGDEMWDRLEGCYHRRGLDWGAGLANPFATCWGARNSLGQWFIYDEYFSNDQDCTTIDHLCNVYEKHEWENHPLFGLTYCDPSSPGNRRIAQKIEQYTKHRPGDIKNFSMAGANNSVLEGIEHIMHALKPQIPVTDEATGKTRLEPRLFIHKSCVNLIREFKTYRWIQANESTNSLNPISPRREPLKIDDHAIDALRYMIFTDDGREGMTIETVKNRSKNENLVPGIGRNGGGNRWKEALGIEE